MPVTSGDAPASLEQPLRKDAGEGERIKEGTARKAKPVGDAQSLFNDDPKISRRLTAAEARSKARRCPTCGAVVPMGMSLCSTCGLDLESGIRVAVDDDLLPASAPSGPSFPLPISIIGGICFLGSIIFTIVALSLWLKGHNGYQYFVPFCLFAVYAAAQFLRRKSIKLLLIALTFGVMIDLIVLIAMPIVHATTDATPIHRTAPSDEPDQADVIIPSVAERLDTQKLGLGIGLIVAYAGVSIYLLSPQVRRHFR